MPNFCYIYLHGFASSPRSQKARDLSDRFFHQGIPLVVPDLNQGDFFNLSLSRQIHQVKALFPPMPTPVILIGSSFGGLTAAWLAQSQLQVARIVLLAPAFQFLSHWLPRLGPTQVQRWQAEQALQVYHYGAEQMLPLGYQFLEDADRYQENSLQRPVPTLILHGIHDEVIPIQASRDYTASRPWASLIELDSDHSLGNVRGEIWEAIQTFCPLKRS